jgi:hypothetical protein
MSATFLEELRCALGWADAELLLMIWAYFDESGEYEQGKLTAMTIGGICAPVEKISRLDAAWRAALADEGLTEFHMTDFEAWRPPFDFEIGGQRDYAKHRRLLSSLLNILIGHAEHLMGFGDVRPVLADPRRAHGAALEGCFVSAMTHVVHDLWSTYGCVFRGKPAGDSDANQPVIPTQASHRFRSIPATPE